MAQSTASASPAVTTLVAAEPSSPVSTPATTGTTALASAGPQFLKPASPKKRRRSPDISNSSPASAARYKSLSPVSPKTSAFPVLPALTGAAEIMEREKRRKLDNDQATWRKTSDNPQAKAVEALLQGGQSKLSDAPMNKVAETVSAPVAAMAPSIQIPEKGQVGGSQQPSPTSTKSISTMESVVTTTMTANGIPVSSPGQIAEDEQEQEENQGKNESTNGEGSGSKSMTYPGPLVGVQVGDGRRGMSLPGSSTQRDDSKSPGSNKKHKCPYCSTEFTRHHNLKSHLLTHSHEKPYLCQTCDSRFRRLHDLKRHTKLHTGERPHVCPKCNRSFARGDALARHNKGQGGCAGRRSSAGDFGEGDESMDGMIYTTEGASEEPGQMDDESEAGSRRDSTLPSIRRHDAPNNHLQPEAQAVFQRQPSTYPPVVARGPVSGTLYPPTSQNTSGPPISPGAVSPHTNFPPTSAYASHPPYGQPITESPKPLSPGNPHPLSAGDPRNRSPSISSQLANAAYSRRQSTRNTPPTLPPPHSSAPTLPPPHIPMNHVDPRYPQTTSPSGPHPPPGPLQPQGGSYPGPPSGGSNSLSSHGSAAHTSGDRSALPFEREDRLWAVIKHLESKVDGLQAEVARLNSQLASIQPQNIHPPQQPQGAVRLTNSTFSKIPKDNRTVID